MGIHYELGEVPARDEPVDLYRSVGWTEYTKDPKLLEDAVTSSLFVVTARHSGRLVGLARVVGDGLTIAYLQDILVCPDHQRQGVGRELFQRVFAPFQNVRQKVLMTDNDEAQIAFYESLGFTELRNLPHPPSVFCQIGRPPQL